MYCPSCDKSYGAVHSRCPECHSWLKVSSPAGRGTTKKSSVKSAVAQPSPTAPPSSPPVGGVTTAERKSHNSWGDTDSASSPSATSWGSSSDSWGGGGSSQANPSGASWGSDSSKSKSASAPLGSGWGVGAVSEGSSSLTSPAPSWDSGSTPAFESPSLTPSSSSWDSGLAAPAAQAEASESSGWLGGGGASDSWGGGAGLAGAAPVSVEAPPKPMQDPLEPSGTGWLADGPDNPAMLGGQPVAESQSGWLSDSRTESVNSRASVGVGNGWLVEDSENGQSMTEMVDRAIDAQDSDDFVDDSWVDDEIRDGEFDDLDAPDDYAAPSPEVGSMFLKMLLFTFLVLLVGGGVMFLGKDRRSPAELAAEQKAKDLEFARSTVIKAREDLEAGKSALAVPQFEAALGTLEELQAPKDEIYSVTAELGRAQIVSQDLEDAHKTWKRLLKGPEEYQAEAKKGMAEVSKQLRVSANNQLKESKKLYANGESTSVISLGKRALEIFKDHDGNSAQLGSAHAVIARGYLNGRDYHNAEEHFRTAHKLFPGGGFLKELSKIPSSSSSSIRRRPAPRRNVAPPRRAPVRRVVKPRLGTGSPGCRQAVPTASSGGRRAATRSNTQQNTAPAAPPRMKEIPTYRRPQTRNTNSGTRAGSKNVLKTY